MCVQTYTYTNYAYIIVCMHTYTYAYSYVIIRMLTHMHRPTYYMQTDINDKSLRKIIEQTCYTFYATNSVPFYCI